MTFKHALPLVLFVGIALALLVGLGLNPKEIPSVLIDKPAPEFALPPLEGGTLGLQTSDLRTGEVALVNVFASWCVPCRAEHPFLMRLKEEGLAEIHGLNYKDEPEQARRMLDELGDPYVRIGADRSGRVGIDWGVYGVPETFVIDGAGRIRLKHVGPMTEHDLNAKIRPLIEELRKGS
ncbi:MAG: DsbE family thiol:disulfide interchange protein [Sphingomonadales bacterium]